MNRPRHSLSQWLSIALLLAICAIAVNFSACSSWEKQTYQLLAGYQGAINQAVADYQSGRIAQTPANYQLINRARDLDVAAVQAFETYAELKVAAQGASKIDAARQVVTTALDALPPVIADIERLIKGS